MALAAGHMVATTVFFNWRRAFGTVFGVCGDPMGCFSFVCAGFDPGLHHGTRCRSVVFAETRVAEPMAVRALHDRNVLVSHILFHRRDDVRVKAQVLNEALAVDGGTVLERFEMFLGVLHHDRVPVPPEQDFVALILFFQALLLDVSFVEVEQSVFGTLVRFLVLVELLVRAIDKRFLPYLSNNTVQSSAPSCRIVSTLATRALSCASISSASTGFGLERDPSVYRSETNSRFELICVATNDAVLLPTTRERSGSARSQTTSFPDAEALTASVPTARSALQLPSATMTSSESSSCISSSLIASDSLLSSVTTYVSSVLVALEQHSTCRGCSRATSQMVTSSSPEPPTTAMYRDFLPLCTNSSGSTCTRLIGKLDPRNFVLLSEIPNPRSHRSRMPLDVPTTAQPWVSSTARLVGIPCERLFCSEKTTVIVRTSRPMILAVGVFLSFMKAVHTIDDSRFKERLDEPVTLVSNLAESQSFSSPDRSAVTKNRWSELTSSPEMAALCSTRREISTPFGSISEVSDTSYTSVLLPNSI
ncbi:hypothetical protein OGAPHI_002013 [Ogataea philodendri]|uniref:Uncharacterized protein n=1 Tax=Ogataea philodendri TaxID=1378263 RepID=A0A9P8PB65_9ASCO|nr:uncharacterized protein OGAPHI_002013 [Ogataea philodendri]KAH3668259.1 hypothetical protein OGAPHI_002013 [Ogataea philodendri]